MSINTTFSIFWILDFLKFEISTAGLVWRANIYASSCQMLCRSVKPLPRCHDFGIFQDGGRRHPGF